MFLLCDVVIMNMIKNLIYIKLYFTFDWYKSTIIIIKPDVGVKSTAWVINVHVRWSKVTDHDCGFRIKYFDPTQLIEYHVYGRS